MLKSCARPRLAVFQGEHATERHLLLGGARPKGSALVAPELEKWVASQATLKESRKGRKET